MDYNKIIEEIEEGKAILLDVREPMEWEEDHLIHSQLLPITELTERVEELPRDKKIYTHCRRGGRASEAAAYLNQTFENVTPLVTFFEELKRAGL